MNIKLKKHWLSVILHRIIVIRPNTILLPKDSFYEEFKFILSRINQNKVDWALNLNYFYFWCHEFAHLLQAISHELSDDEHKWWVYYLDHAKELEAQAERIAENLKNARPYMFSYYYDECLRTGKIHDRLLEIKTVG